LVSVAFTVRGLENSARSTETVAREELPGASSPKKYVQTPPPYTNSPEAPFSCSRPAGPLHMSASPIRLRVEEAHLARKVAIEPVGDACHDEDTGTGDGGKAPRDEPERDEDWYQDETKERKDIRRREEWLRRERPRQRCLLEVDGTPVVV
jgi:hypothetical protein